MLLKKSFKVILFALAVVFLISAAASAQVGKFGYVDSDKIFAEFKAWIKAQEEFNT